jgi:hypothetical protein
MTHSRPHHTPLHIEGSNAFLKTQALWPEVGKFKLKSNDDDVFSNDFFQRSNADKF